MSAPSRGGGGGGRGRGRGGGGGGGGGRSGGGGGGAQPPMGTLTWSEFSEVDRQKPTKSYPPMDEEPKVSLPSAYESKVIAYQLGYLEHQRNSLWWPVVEDRKVREVTRYSDRYQKGQQAGQTGATTTTTANPQTASSLSLSDPSIVNTLQKDAFPTQLWNVYMNAETRQQERGKKREEMRLKGDWKKLIDSVEMGGGADRLSEGAPSEEEDEGALDEYEDDEEDDYADNYFDNGEDDDIQDEGGEGAEETYE